MRVHLLWCVALVNLAVAPAYAGAAVHMSGSSTVFPYAKLVAESFGEVYPDYKTPIVESTGSGAGIKQFCQSDNESSLDIANASRPMTKSEFSECAKNGVTKIQQVIFGFDGIVFVSDRQGPAWNFTPKDVYNAMAKQVVVNGKLVDNPYKNWQEVNKSFANWPITAYIPSEKHGTREVFEEKLLLNGCEASGALDLYKKQGMDSKQAKAACISVRKDGAVIDIDGDYSETLGRLAANKRAIGVLGLYFYENNTDKLRVATVNSVEPNARTIADQSYLVSRPLYFYVKQSHLNYVPGLSDYVNFFLLDQMVGEDGLLEQYGLVASPTQMREQQRKDFADGKLIQVSDLP